MNKNRFSMMIIAGAVVLTVIFATLHLSSRTQVAEGGLLIQLDEQQSVTLEINSLNLTDVTGQVRNAKGETRNVAAKGMRLADILLTAGVDSNAIRQVTVTASDEYSAVVLSEEIKEAGKVFLILQDDGMLQLVVFGDENSKRKVTNVTRVMVE